LHTPERGQIGKLFYEGGRTEKKNITEAEGEGGIGEEGGKSTPN